MWTKTICSDLPLFLTRSNSPDDASAAPPPGSRTWQRGKRVRNATDQEESSKPSAKLFSSAIRQTENKMTDLISFCVTQAVIVVFFVHQIFLFKLRTHEMDQTIQWKSKKRKPNLPHAVCCWTQFQGMIWLLAFLKHATIEVCPVKASQTRPKSTLVEEVHNTMKLTFSQQFLVSFQF